MSILIPLGFLVVCFAFIASTSMARESRRHQRERNMIASLNDYYTPGGLLDPLSPHYDAEADRRRKEENAKDWERWYGREG